MKEGALSEEILNLKSETVVTSNHSPFTPVGGEG